MPAAKRAAPLMAMLLASVAPEVKMISLRVGADQGGDLRPGRLDRGFRLAAHDVLHAVRIAVVFGEIRQHRLRRTRGSHRVVAWLSR